MSELKPSFRLYDFLAYLFPGIATFLALKIIFPVNFHELKLQLTTSNTIIEAACVIILAYVIGLFWSVFYRELIRPLIWIKSNPRIYFYNPKDPQKTPIGNDMLLKLRVEAEKFFNIENNAYRVRSA